MMLLVAALIGATLLVVRGTVFKPLRKLWPALFECGQCFGFWVGAAAGATGIVSVGHGPWIDAIVVGSATSFLATLADAILLKLLGEP